MEEPIRVAQVVGKMNGGGVESVVMNYYRHIDRSRVQFDFLVDADSTLVPREEINQLGGRVFNVPPYQHINVYQKELVHLFQKYRWPIVHSHLNALSLFPLRAAKRAGIPVRIAHSHSTSGGRELTKNALKAILKHFSYVYPTHRFACSRYAGKWLFGPLSDFELVYNAIELTRFDFDSQTRNAMRANLGISDQQLVVGHIGRFMPQKNHRFIIDVFAELASKRSDVILLLVGDGEDKIAVEHRAANLGIADKVLFLGQRNDVDQLYQAFDVFILPSLYEGLGIVAIEAQRAGLPCVLSDKVPDEVDLTGNVDFLPVDDVRPWVEYLLTMRSGNRCSIRENDFVQYDINRAAERLTLRYIDLIG